MEQKKKYDLQFLQRIADDDSAFIIDMVKTFIATSHGVKTALDTYNAAGNYEELGREVHRFVSGVSFLGATDLEERLVLLETLLKNAPDSSQVSPLVEEVKEEIALLVKVFTDDFSLEKC